MTYNPNIPLSTDIPSQSQGQFLTNFQQLDSIFGVNHVTFDSSDVTDRGKHNFTTLIEQVSAPVTAADEIALYSTAVSGVSELFFARESAGATIQMTTGNTITAANGSSFLPGGLQIKWGTFAMNLGVTSQAVTFASPFPTGVFSITFGGEVAGVLVAGFPITTTGFTALRVPGSFACTHFYIAIGN